MTRKSNTQKRFKWLIGLLILLWIAALVYYFQWYSLLIKDNTPKENNPDSGKESITPVFYGYSGGGGGGSNSNPTNESMTFEFVDLLEQTFSHNKGRYVTSEIVNEQGEEILLATTQTFNDITLQSTEPITGTLIVQ